MKLNITLLLTIILFFTIGCKSSINKNVEPVRKRISIRPLEGPAWLLNPPKGNYPIGISRKSFNRKEMKDACKQFATIMYARNSSSINVNKYLRVVSSSNSSYSENSAKFRIAVSSNPELKNLYSKLSLLRESFIDGYYIAIYGLEKDISNPSNSNITYPDIIPDWFDKIGLKVQNKSIKYLNTASSADLIKAYVKAFNEARIALATYKQKTVEAKTKYEVHLSNQHNREVSSNKKAIAIETVFELGKIYVDKVHIRRVYKDSLFSYKVYLSIMIKE